MRTELRKIASRVSGFVRKRRAPPPTPTVSSVQPVELSVEKPVVEKPLGPPTFRSLSEMPSEDTVPLLDRATIDESVLTTEQREWRRDGVVILPRFLPDALMDAYSEVRARHWDPGGWPCPVPYMHVPELLALATYRPLMLVLKDLLTEEMGLGLSLTGWQSTERAWHQDDYLNPDFVNSWYAAVWMALDDIHPDSGPFQYVPGSHKWPVMRGERVKAHLGPEERNTPMWPIHGEKITTPIYEEEIKRSGLPVRSFIARRGDVLIWHGRLVHQGSLAKKKGMMRKALIAHYTAVVKRPDWPIVGRTDEGSVYFKQDIPLDKAE